MEKTRIDKYLWAIRIYKSRTMATEACREGKVKLNGTVVKSSALIVPGDILDVYKDNFRFKYKVVQLIEKRVSAILAKPCYEDLTPEDELNKYKSWFVGKGGPERRERGAGRPTKKERREIEGFKEDDDDEED
ncbi:MAG TPA: RNA-binding S4 domain-containing protein [Saprospiraceae bacterium]|nr:RNA-binding S4 domain-containing protein [Saprospiraceae bacterium]